MKVLIRSIRFSEDTWWRTREAALKRRLDTATYLDHVLREANAKTLEGPK